MGVPVSRDVWMNERKGSVMDNRLNMRTWNIVNCEIMNFDEPDLHCASVEWFKKGCGCSNTATSSGWQKIWVEY